MLQVPSTSSGTKNFDKLRHQKLRQAQAPKTYNQQPTTNNLYQEMTPTTNNIQPSTLLHLIPHRIHLGERHLF
jgi:hypothetical protein